MIISRLKLCILASLFSQFGLAEIVIHRADFAKWVSAYNKQMPDGYRIRESYDIDVLKKDDCVEIEKYEVTGSRVKRRHIIFNAKCLTRTDINEIQERNFDLSNLGESKIKTALLNEAVLRNPRFNERNRKSLSAKIYKNNYFGAVPHLGISINDSIKNIIRKFYKIGTFQYISNPDFFEQHPSVYCFFKEDVFSGQEFFPSSCAEVEKYKASNYGRYKVLHSPREALYARYEVLSRAKESIQFQYFSLFNEVFGQSFLGLLKRKLEEGVKVDVMLDVRGTLNEGLKKYLQVLVNKGARVRMYNPILLNSGILDRTLRTGLFASIPNSNHDKIIIVDGQYLIVGGRNIGERYFVEQSEALNFVYEDLDIVLEVEKDPFTAKKAFYSEFYSNVSSEVSENKRLDAKYEGELDMALEAMEAVLNNRLQTMHLRFFPELDQYKSITDFKDWELDFSSEVVKVEGLDNTSQYYNIKEINDKFIDLIDQAQESIIIQNPYIVISEKLFSALKNAANKRDVQVTFVVSTYKSSDLFPPVNDLTDNWQRMLGEIKGAKMFGYLGEYKSHTKLAIIDGDKSIIGSYNLDPLSEVKNSEFVYLVHSKGVAQECMKKVNQTINDSLEYDLSKGIGPLSIPDTDKTDAYKYRWINFLIRDII